MTPDEFVTGLLAAVPEARDLVDEHVADHCGEMLLHLLMADVERLCRAAFVRGDHDLSSRCLTYVASALTQGDDLVWNAVAVSFVENAGPWDASAAAYISSWPSALQVEADRQQSAR
jgi:hypothetical protein